MKTNMKIGTEKGLNTRKLVINAILIAIGVILRQITPPIFGIQSDFSLAMLFIIIVMNKDYKTTFIVGIVMGIFAALTTKTPNGQIPLIIDKILTSNIIYLLLLPIRSKIKDTIQIIISLSVGTMLSGSIFLCALSFLSGLPTTFMFLLITVVLPTMVINCVLGTALYKIVIMTMKRIGFA